MLALFDDVWRAFMCHDAVRAWLFDRAPPSRSQAYACVTNQPEPLSFSFNGAADSLHDFRELGTVLYHASGTALGVTFGHCGKQPLLPVAHQFTGDVDYTDNSVIVRRCAIRRASPRSRHLLRLQLDWFSSGVLGVDYSFIPAIAPDLRPSVGFAVFGYRVFKRDDAQKLFNAAIAPDQRFLDGSSSLLSPIQGYVSLEGCDSLFRTSCTYCTHRNNVLCDCPVPLRRRVVGDNSQYDPAVLALMSPAVDHQIVDENDEATINEMVWNYYSYRMKLSLNMGTYLTNWRYIRPTMPQLNNVVVAHTVPYSVFRKAGCESPILQRVLTGLGLQSNTPQLLSPSDQQQPVYDRVKIADVTEMVDETAQNAGETTDTTPSSLDAIYFDDALLQLGATFGAASMAQSIADGVTALLKRQRTVMHDMDGVESCEKAPDGTEIKRSSKKETRKWQCDQCTSVIRGKRSNLTRHIQNKHTNVRPFECVLPNCSKRFQTRLNLKRHQGLVHAGRPHACSGCARSFKTADKLERHVAAVHQPGATPMACPTCGNCYGKRSTLSRHIAHVHKALSEVTIDPDPDPDPAKLEPPSPLANTDKPVALVTEPL